MLYSCAKDRRLFSAKKNRTRETTGTFSLLSALKCEWNFRRLFFPSLLVANRNDAIYLRRRDRVAILIARNDRWSCGFLKSVIVRQETLKRERKRKKSGAWVGRSPIYIKNGKMQNQIRPVGRAGRSPRELRDRLGHGSRFAGRASLLDTFETDQTRRLADVACWNHWLDDV